MKRHLHFSTALQPLSLNQKKKKSGNGLSAYAERFVQFQNEWEKQRPFPQAIRAPIIIHIYLPFSCFIDVDNSSKMILDSMKGIVYEDDCQIISFHIRRCRGDILRVKLREYSGKIPDDMFQHLERTIESRYSHLHYLLKRTERERENW